MPPARSVVALLVLSALAGCFGGDEPPAAAPEQEVAPAADPLANATLPEGRGVSSGNMETNRTEEGLGGREHKHDRWEDRDQIVLVQRNIDFDILPLFPEGEGSTPRGVAYVTPPSDAQVWEGTAKVLVLAEPLPIRDVPHPAPPVITLQYRSAADSEWRPVVPLAYGQTVEIPVSARETDMPHATASLWNFRFLADRPNTLVEGINVTITAVRGHEVADWPGHPDFYAETASRVVFDGEVRTHQYGFPENGFYESMESWTAPERLISHGTGELHIFANITAFASQPPLPVTEYVLYAHNATEMGLGCCDGEVYTDADGRNDLKSYHFVVPVDAAGMDSPYQPASRWGFHLSAVTGVIFTDATSYDIDYHMTIVALKAAEPEPAVPPA